MRATSLTDGPPRQHVLVFETGDELVSRLTDWASEQRLGGSSFTGIGAFCEATLGYYDLQTQEYVEIPVDDQVELLVLAGDVTLDGQGGWNVHAHATCGRRDGSVIGGHVLRAVVRPTLELVVTTTPTHLQRRHDAASGLAPIQPGA
jgi:predicted DNA-binding protein with PD1-like motif